MEIRFEDLMAEMGITSARELINLCRRNGLPQISRDRPISKRDADAIVGQLRGGSIEWLSYKKKNTAEQYNLQVLRGIKNIPHDWIEYNYKKLLDGEGYTRKESDLSIGIVVEGGFLKRGPSLPFIYGIRKGCNILIGERGAGKSTALALLGALSESTTERTGVFAKDVVQQLEASKNSVIDIKHIRKSLLMLGVEKYALFFNNGSYPMCFFIDVREGYEIFRRSKSWEIDRNKLENIVIPKINIFRQGDIFRISDVGDVYILARLVDLLTPSLANSRAEAKKRLVGVCRQLEISEFSKFTCDRVWLSQYYSQEMGSLNDTQRSNSARQRADGIVTWLQERILRGREAEPEKGEVSIKLLLQKPEIYADYYVYSLISGALSSKLYDLQEMVENSARSDEDFDLATGEIKEFVQTRLRALTNIAEVCEGLTLFRPNHEDMLRGISNYFRNRSELFSELSSTCERISRQLREYGVLASLELTEFAENDVTLSERSYLAAMGVELTEKLFSGSAARRIGDLREIANQLRRVQQYVSAISVLPPNENSEEINQQVYDQVEAFMLQGTSQKSFHQLSFGQRAALILMMVIQNTDADWLLLDQPEDHLDVSAIVNIVAPTLKSISARKAVCIATHSNNLVLGIPGALITSMQSQGEYGLIAARGPISSQGIINEMLKILEGGEESFISKIEFYSEIAKKFADNIESSQLAEIGKELRQRTVDDLRNLLQPIVTDSALLKTARHELRNILGTSAQTEEGETLLDILRPASLAGEAGAIGELVMQVEAILKSWDSHVDLMLAGIDQMRAVDAVPRTVQVDVSSVLNEIVASETSSFDKERKHRLSIEIGRNLKGLYVHFDAVHFKLVFENLIRNALGATGEVSFELAGDGRDAAFCERIEVDVASVEEEDGYIVISLRDNGIGLREGDVKRIYKEKGFTLRPGGTGIGCQIVSRFLAVNGGSVRVVESQYGLEGKGTVQNIKLPFAKAL